MKTKLLFLPLMLMCFSASVIAQSNRSDERSSVIENTIRSAARGGDITETEARPHGSFRGRNRNGYAEVFIRIFTNDIKYTVTVGDQTIINNNGFYRFYDVPANSNLLITISRGSYTLFKGFANIRNQYRYIMDYDGRDRQLYLLDVIRAGNPGDRDNTWNDYYKNMPLQIPLHPNPAHNSMAPVMNDRAFGSFLNTVSEASFGSTQINMIRAQARSSSFTGAQIKALCLLFSFDSDRLTVAKELYRVCVDPENYFTVSSSFTFDSSKEELQRYIVEMR